VRPHAPDVTPAGANDGLLLEREAEVAALDEAIRSALSGHGSVVLIEGSAGIGKTLLLEETSRRATGSGMRVASARAAVLERDFGFGVVRKLFEPIVGRAPPQARHRLLAGAAAIAGSLVAPDDAVQPGTRAPAAPRGRGRSRFADRRGLAGRGADMNPRRSIER
jgi:hypothetical protein